MYEEEFDETIEATLSAIRRRRMVLPAILFLAGHRPLAFALGQMLFVLQPLTALLGSDGLDSWAHVLSHPGGPAALTDRLADLLEKDRPAARGLRTET